MYRRFRGKRLMVWRWISLRFLYTSFQSRMKINSINGKKYCRSWISQEFEIFPELVFANYTSWRVTMSWVELCLKEILEYVGNLEAIVFPQSSQIFLNIYKKPSPNHGRQSVSHRAFVKTSWRPSSSKAKWQESFSCVFNDPECRQSYTKIFQNSPSHLAIMEQDQEVHQLYKDARSRQASISRLWKWTTTKLIRTSYQRTQQRPKYICMVWSGACCQEYLLQLC